MHVYGKVMHTIGIRFNRLKTSYGVASEMWYSQDSMLADGNTFGGVISFVNALSRYNTYKGTHLLVVWIKKILGA